MNAEVFERRNAEETTYGAYDDPSCLVTVRRWQRREAAEGRWESLTKCGVTECVMDRRRHDGPSFWFVMKIREVVPVPKFQELECFGPETLNRPLCL